MTLRQLGEAAVRHSDNTAVNLLFEEVGGPAALDAALTELGDDVMNVARTEPEPTALSPGTRGTPARPRRLPRRCAVAVDDALEPSGRAQLGVAARSTTGPDAVRAGAPRCWVVGDKTGTAGYDTRNDIAVLWPTDDAPPVVLAVLSSRAAEDAEPDDELLAEATRQALAALG